jgi:hypothetical protein
VNVIAILFYTPLFRVFFCQYHTRILRHNLFPCFLTRPGVIYYKVTPAHVFSPVLCAAFNYSISVHDFIKSSPAICLIVKAIALSSLFPCTAFSPRRQQAHTITPKKPHACGASSSHDRALASIFRRQQTARRSLKADMLEKAMDQLMLPELIWV